MLKPILFVAFHFPPCFGSSGLQRTLSFVRYFANKKDWQPIVLSASALAYPKCSDGQLLDVPSSVPVEHAFALDSSRHLAIAGRYLGATARPDKWITWYLGAVPAGLWLIRKYRPVAIWSTYPIATAHSIGGTLARLSNLPWVCDFRDPMVEYDAKTRRWFPSDQADRNARLRVERKCVKYASRLVFCTDSAQRICTSRYPEVDTDRCHVVPNGYDESIFAGIEDTCQAQRDANPDIITLLHSGTLYPGDDRDPSTLFQALQKLKKDGFFVNKRLQVLLRATGFDHIYQAQIAEMGIEDIVILAPAIEYKDAIVEMMSATALLLFQGRTSDPAIPAKLYEYLRCKRPILALVHEGGETSRLLHSLNFGLQVPMDDVAAIRRNLVKFISSLKNDQFKVLDSKNLEMMSRGSGARKLENILLNTVATNQKISA